MKNRILGLLGLCLCGFGFVVFIDAISVGTADYIPQDALYKFKGIWGSSCYITTMLLAFGIGVLLMIKANWLEK